MNRAMRLIAERSRPGWRPTEEQLGYLQTHDCGHGVLGDGADAGGGHWQKDLWRRRSKQR